MARKFYADRSLEDGTVQHRKMASNAFVVTANSASTANANSVNFVNTATVTVTVTNQQSGVANVSFTSSEAGLNPFLLAGM